MKLSHHDRLPDNFFKTLNADWAISAEIGDYIQGDVVTISQTEANDYGKAADELYEMFIAAGDHILENDLFSEMGINENLKEMIEYTWENDNHWHMYGRFDFAGGIDGKPVKLIEFNADTATSLPETAIFQWAHLMDNDFNMDSQFNEIFEKLIQNFKTLLEMNPDKEPNMLFTYMDSQEDKANMEFMAKAAVEAGFAIEFRELPEIIFSDNEEEGGVWVDYGDDRFQRFDFWFKLIPWEFLAVDEPELIKTLTKITKDENCVILNPAYTMLFQSKMIMKVLWDLYPNHPLLLKTVDTPLTNEKHVKKVIFGREGANVYIIDSDGSEIETKDGDYGANASVYQEYAELPTDIYGSSYQAGVFYIGGSAGLGYRRGTKIMNDTAEFVSHYIQE
jgi:glutathionylspermidine synthase